MARCRGLHCDGCGHHGGAKWGAGFGGLVLLAAVLVYAAHRRVIDHTAAAIGNIILITLAVAGGLVMGVGAGLAALRVRRVIVARQATRRMLAPPHVVVLPGRDDGPARPAVQAPQRRWLLTGWPQAISSPVGGEGDDTHRR